MWLFINKKLDQNRRFKTFKFIDDIDTLKNELMALNDEQITYENVLANKIINNKICFIRYCEF